MKNIYSSKKILLVIFSLLLSISIIRANNEQPQGIDLGEYAFGIPVEQLNFTNQSPFTLSFWVKVKEFDHSEYGTLFVSIRNPKDPYVMSDYGWMWAFVEPNDSKNILNMAVRSSGSSGFDAEELSSFDFIKEEWLNFSFVFDYDEKRMLTLYLNGTPVYEVKGTYETYSWTQQNIIMIGGISSLRSPLNAYIDEVQLYKKALSQAQIIKIMTSPLIRDSSLLGYWDFKDDCSVDADGFMKADKGSAKATMYKILTSGIVSTGTEVQPFTFGEGVDPESVIQGVEESVTNESKAKAFISNEILRIENAEGIDSVVVYDAMGRVITSTNANGATSTQITLPSNTKGVIILKVNNEVIKVACNN